VLAILPSTAPAADLNFHDGLWRVEVSTDMHGLGMKPAPPYRYQACYSRRDITERLVPRGSPCRAIPSETRGDEVSWTLQCLPRMGEINGTIRMKFQGDRMEGTVATRTGYPETLEVIQHISGQRVGDCKSVPRQPVPGAPPQERPPLPDYDPTK